MKVDELQPGDIIFFIRQYLNDEEREDYVDHVAMYTGKKRKQHSITHAIDKSGDNRLCITTLRPIEYEDREDQENSYLVRYEVFRSKNADLAVAAAEQISRWASYRVPYDIKRGKDLEELEEQSEFSLTPEKDQLVLSKKRYLTEGIYRAIKFAVRRDIMPTRAKKDGIGRGLICTSAVVLSYQVAEINEQVHACSSEDKFIKWPSDKYADLDMSQEREKTKAISCWRYKGYVGSLREKQSEDDKHKRYTPSILSWRCKQCATEYFEQYPSKIALDSKNLTCAALKLYLEQNPSNWESCGVLLDVPEDSFTEEEKRIHKDQRDSNHQAADDYTRGLESKIK